SDRAAGGYLQPADDHLRGHDPVEPVYYRLRDSRDLLADAGAAHGSGRWRSRALSGGLLAGDRLRAAKTALDGDRALRRGHLYWIGTVVSARRFDPQLCRDQERYELAAGGTDSSLADYVFPCGLAGDSVCSAALHYPRTQDARRQHSSDSADR